MGLVPDMEELAGPPIYRIEGRNYGHLGLYRFDHPVMSISLRPNYSRKLISYWDCRPIHVKTDARGFRQPLSPPRSDQVRVMVIGDSVTFGVGADPEETFVEQMNQGQQARYFLNFGVGNASLATYEGMLRYYGQEVQPGEVVIVICLGNDVYNLSRDHWPEMERNAPPTGRVSNLDHAFQVDPPPIDGFLTRASSLVRLLQVQFQPKERNLNGNAFSPILKSFKYLEWYTKQISFVLLDHLRATKLRVKKLVANALKSGNYTDMDVEVAQEFLAHLEENQFAAAFELQRVLSKYPYPAPHATRDQRFEFNRKMVDLRNSEFYLRQGLPADPALLQSSITTVYNAISSPSSKVRKAHSDAQRLTKKIAGRTLNLADDEKARLKECLDRLIQKARKISILVDAFNPSKKLEIIFRAYLDQSRKLNAKLYFVLIPGEYQLETIRRGSHLEPLVALRSILARFNKDHGIPVLDLSDWMVRQWHKHQGGLYVDWSHLSPLGHRIMAEKILSFLPPR